MRNKCLIALLSFCCVTAYAQTDSIAETIVEPDANKAIHYNRGLEFYSRDKYPEAILSFDSCLLLDSSFIDARFMKAITLEKAGNLTEALNEFKRIKNKNPRYDDIDKRIGNYYLTIYLSKNWYYMITMLFIVVLIMAIVVKTVAYKKVQ